MRTRLLSIASALALTLGGLVVAQLPASPASADCSGHATHPDVYENGEFHYTISGTVIRRYPHYNCGVVGLGFADQGTDVHCAVQTGARWIYIRNLSNGLSGWSREDDLNIDRPASIRDCVSANLIHLFY